MSGASQLEKSGQNFSIVDFIAPALALDEVSLEDTSENFQRLPESRGITCSMSRRGNCWDNAAMESFFSSMKTERLSKKHYRTREEQRADVFDYIERFYYARRRHSTIGYISPIQFENLKCA